MTPKQFIKKYTDYFGEAAPLPIAVIYSAKPLGEIHSIPGCMFKQLHWAANGNTVSLDAESLKCGGGKFYSGFIPIPERVFNFVSMVERYKLSAEIAEESIKLINPHRSEEPYLNFVRVDQLESFDEMEGVVFFVNPDVMSGLFVWANYDQSNINEVQVPFASGCSATITSIVNENRRNGKHCYIGMLDVSARPYFRPDILSFAIPRSRFVEMCETMSQCCISGAPAWLKIKKRINRV